MTIAAKLWLAAALLIGATPAVAEEGEGRRIEVFSIAQDGTRQRLTSVDLDALPQRARRGPDPQYDREVCARGVPLAAVLARVEVPEKADLALLRFDDGVQIPVAFRDAGLMATLAPFVARAATTDCRAKLSTGRIEEPRRGPTEEDLRPLRFHGNKVIVSDAGLAPVLPSVAKDLRPWMFADSLFSIELVERASWERRFEAGAATREGQRIFLGSCRFCHAIRGAGGAMGWDFVDPYPIYSEQWVKRLAHDAGEQNPIPARTMLSIHVRHRAGGDASRTMPALRGMKMPEVDALWAWLQAIGALPAAASAR